MPSRKPTQPYRGFFTVGIYQPMHGVNVGTLFRSAQVFNAAMVYTVGKTYKRQASDVFDATKNIPYQHFPELEDLIDHLPKGCPLVGVEIDDRAIPLRKFSHTDRAAYLLGSEGIGLPQKVRDRCHSLIQVESSRDLCLNVSVAGSLVMWHRHQQRERSL